MEKVGRGAGPNNTLKDMVSKIITDPGETCLGVLNPKLARTSNYIIIHRDFPPVFFYIGSWTIKTTIKLLSILQIGRKKIINYFMNSLK